MTSVDNVYYPTLEEVRNRHKLARIAGLSVGKLYCPSCRDQFWDIGTPAKTSFGLFLCEICYLGII